MYVNIIAKLFKTSLINVNCLDCISVSMLAVSNINPLLLSAPSFLLFPSSPLIVVPYSVG